MKTRTLLTAVFMMLVLTVSANAQAVLTLSGSAVDTGRGDGVSEPVGRARVTSASAATTDTFTFNYTGATITNTTATGITITQGSWNGTITFVSISGSSIVLNTTEATTSGFFEVSGVRVALTALSTGPLNVTLGVLSTGNLISGSNSTQVLNSIVSTKTVGGSGDNAANILSTGDLNDADAQVTIKEVSKANFTTLTQEGGSANGTATNGYQINFVLSAALPAGLEIAVSTATSTTASLTATYSPSTINGTAKKFTATITASDQSVKETLVVKFVLSKRTGSNKPSLPLTPVSITLTATSAPTGTVPSSGAAAKRPSFIDDPLDGGTLMNVVSSSTSLLYTFVTWQPSLGFDSGIAIANTSADPFTLGSATPAAGTISFHLMPADGSANVTWTTPDSLASGATYQKLLSEIAGAAGLTSFTGYMIAVCNFTHGHGEGFVLDAGKIAQTLNALVIRNPAVNDRDVLIATGGETLGR